MKKISVSGLTLRELRDMVVGSGLPAYRANQVFKRIFGHGVFSFDEMKEIPADMRKRFSEQFTIDIPEIAERLLSGDGTRKYLFKLSDDACVETVIIPADGRNTICLSTQVGCRYACRFCSSDKRGFLRNLETAEIIGQILFAVFIEKKRINNVVFMGMGEPFDNYDNVIKAAGIINSAGGLNIAARKITVSTAGVVPGILKFAENDSQFRLSVSLHAADDALRTSLMPINKTYPLGVLFSAIKKYISKTDRRITLEYILIRNTNDSPECAEKLAVMAKSVEASVNIIPCSSPGKGNFERPHPSQTEKFAKIVERNNVVVTIRTSKGADIKAACGQLAGRKSR